MEKRAHLNRNVLLTGCTSFFTDVSTEMVYPLLQAFVKALTASRALLAGPMLGIIEGTAESTASLLKVFSGYFSDRIRKRKTPTIIGYSLSALAKLLFFFAAAGWYFVLLARVFDRIGKGIRSAPRDALIAESIPYHAQGRAFGLQRAMDFAGAATGVLVLYFLSLRFLDPATGTIGNFGNFYALFAISIVPALIGIGFLFFVKETGSVHISRENASPRPSLDIRRYDLNLRRFFLCQALFTLGNSSNQFLLLRSMELGHALPSVILLYMLFNLSTALFAKRFGSIADRIGHKRVLSGGYALYAIVYGTFAFITPKHSFLLWGFWILYGVYYAMTDGVEKAFVSRLAPAESRATAIGFLHMISGIGLLPASLIAGVLFSIHPGAPFLFGAITSAATVVMLATTVKERR
ncbi:MAG: MFS transporter [Chitinispirillaceae bacterium]|nr:MFS transporter [Chitinispirillaceae bacterium]